MKFNLASNSGQALWLAIANFISFSFGIVSAAILSRFLSVEEYGSYKQVLYTYSTLLTVFTLGLPRAYSFFLARLPIEEGHLTVNRINGLFLLFGAAFALTLFFGSSFIASVLKNPELTILLKWFAPTPLFLLPIMGLESIMATYRKASYATIYVVLSRTFTLVCVVIPVLIRGGVSSAIIGFSVASVLCFCVGYILERKPFKGVHTQPSTLNWKEVIHYSLPLLFASIWGIIAQSTPQFFISRWWGTEEFAEFSNGFIELPFASMIMGAVATVLLPAFSREAVKSDGKTEIIRLWNESFIKSAKIIFPLAIYAFVFAHPIMDFLYGDKYTGSAIYFRIIAFINLSRVMQYGPILLALNKTREYARLQMYCVLSILAISIPYVYLFHSPYGIAVVYVVCNVFLIMGVFNILHKTLNVKVSDLIPSKTLVKIVFAAIISSMIAYVAFKFILTIPVFMLLLLSSILFGIIFLLVANTINLDYKIIIRSFISK